MHIAVKIAQGDSTFTSLLKDAIIIILDKCNLEELIIWYKISFYSVSRPVSLYLYIIISYCHEDITMLMLSFNVKKACLV